MIAQDNVVFATLDSNKKILQKKSEVYFFVQPAQDINPDEKFDVFNQKKWSILRKLCYDFFRSEMKDIHPDSLVLDVGMGQAQFKDLYHDMTVIGADFYPYPDVRVVCDFTKPLPFKDQSFDVIFSSNVMEHLPNPEQVLQEYHRVLKKGGRFIAAVPFLIGIHQAPYDFYRYTHFLLDQLLHKTGFIEQRVTILGTGLDAYLHTQEKFFSLIRDSKDKKKTFLGKLFIWFLAKLAEIFQFILNALCWPLFKRVGKTPKLPLGYGIIAIK